MAQALERLAPPPLGTSFVELDSNAGMWEVGAYFANPPDEVGLALLSAAYSAKRFVVSELPDVDWVSKAQRQLHPVWAGRYWIFGCHSKERLPAGLIPIRIDSTMAFGTGHHATTQGCLVALDAIVSKGSALGNVADIGCGTAVLAIAAAKSGAVGVTASDLDPVAIEVAKKNVAANDMEHQITCIQAHGLEHPVHQGHRPYSLVFANILNDTLIQLADSMRDFVIPGGFAVLSGILSEQAREIVSAYVMAGFREADRSDIDEWATLTMIRI